MVDCSHGNSGKDYRNQYTVLRNVIGQAIENPDIIGIMLESNINEGKQKLVSREKLKYGVSITDCCISIENTNKYLIEIHALWDKKKGGYINGVSYLKN
jgi:3-deoxy-7-phosphoheptulonate synthase